MKILIVSGFLGAGKTTFIKAVSRALHRKFVIVENEFSEMDVDAEMLNVDDVSIKTYEISEGCICCSVNIDFTHSLLTIANALDPDYLVVEPSGVADIENLVKRISKIAYEKIEILSPVVLIDGQNPGNFSVPDFSTVAVTKSENFGKEDFENIFQGIKAKDVFFYDTHYSNWSKADFEQLFLRKLDFKGDVKLQKLEKSEKNLNFQNVSIENPAFDNMEDLIIFLKDVTYGRYGDIYRAKGMTHGFKFDLVGGNYSITSTKSEESKIILIGEKPDFDMLSRKLMHFSAKVKTGHL